MLRSPTRNSEAKTIYKSHSNNMVESCSRKPWWGSQMGSRGARKCLGAAQAAARGTPMGRKRTEHVRISTVANLYGSLLWPKFETFFDIFMPFYAYSWMGTPNLIILYLSYSRPGPPNRLVLYLVT